MTSPIAHPSTWPPWVVIPLVICLLYGFGLIVWEIWTVSSARYHWRRRRRGRS